MDARLFNALASDGGKALPYNKDIADQRRKYGESMLRKAEAHMQRQLEYERQHEVEIEAARKRREEDEAKAEAKRVGFGQWLFSAKTLRIL